jgi:hypothetical protein
LASLGLLLAVPHLVPGRHQSWDSAQSAVAGFVLALLSLPIAVSTFGRREELRSVGLGPATPGSVARIPMTLLSIWMRCLVIGSFGCLLAYGAASPRAAWPYLSAAAVLLVLHAPRQRMFERAPP